MSLVRANLLSRKGYTPYCGGLGCYDMPRTRFTGKQFTCGSCGWVSEFPEAFISEYKKLWGIK